VAESTFGFPKKSIPKYGLFGIPAYKNNQGGNQGYTGYENAIHPEFLVPQNPLYLPFEGKITKYKVTSGQEHKKDDDILYKRLVIPVSQASVLC